MVASAGGAVRRSAPLEETYSVPVAMGPGPRFGAVRGL